jgi:F-type H+-transporting ATPase subunit c
MEMEAAKVIAAGLMAFGMMGAAIGIGHIFAAFLSGIARNPSTEKKMMVWAFVGAGMAELMGLVAIVIALMNLI